jgi:hypothetical protein
MERVGQRSIRAPGVTNAVEPARRGATRPPTELGRRARVIRLLFVAAAAGLLLYGSAAGRDDMFPFGPFTMYSGFFPPNGVIVSTSITAENAAGRSAFVTQADTGIPRGDIEGELGAYQRNPGRLGDLAAAFHSRFPDAPPYVEMRIVQTRWQLHDRSVVSTSHVTLVEWHAS